MVLTANESYLSTTGAVIRLSDGNHTLMLTGNISMWPGICNSTVDIVHDNEISLVNRWCSS